MKYTRHQRWMQAFEAKVLQLAPQHAGKIEWPTAEYFYNTEMHADDAATKYVATRDIPAA